MQYCLFLIAFFFFTATSAQSQEWQPVGRASFEAIAGLSDGTLVLIQYPGDILRSTDKGETWSVVYCGGAWQTRLVSIAEKRETIEAYGDSGVALVSRDSGRTWEGNEGGGMETAGKFPALILHPSSLMVRLDDSSNVLLSRDSNRSWVRVLKRDSGCTIHSVVIIDSVCYAVGEPGLMYVSDISFTKWREIHRAPFGEAGDVGPKAPTSAHIEFSSVAHGAITFGDEIFVTDDSGTSWCRSIISERDFMMKSPLDSTFRLPKQAGEIATDTCFPDHYTGFVLTDSTTLLDTLTHDGLDTTIIHDTGYIYRSLDGRSTWSLVLKGIPGLKKLFFVNPHLGFACGSNGIIMRTDDTGSTWRRAYTPIKQNLHDVRLVNDSTGYAVGDSGVVLFTRNAGKWWLLALPAPLSSHPTTSYSSIAFSEMHTVFVLGGDRCYKQSIPNPILGSRSVHHRQQQTTLSISVSPNPTHAELDIEILSISSPPTEDSPSLVIDDVSGRPVINNIHCIQNGSGHWSAKVILTDVNSGVFSAIATLGGQMARCNFVLER